MITDIKNWTEVTRGIYRYVIAAKAAYEIHILNWNTQLPIESSRASLCIVGDWITSEGNFFDRELLVKDGSLLHCLFIAEQDYRENC